MFSGNCLLLFLLLRDTKEEQKFLSQQQGPRPTNKFPELCWTLAELLLISSMTMDKEEGRGFRSSCTGVGRHFQNCIWEPRTLILQEIIFQMPFWIQALWLHIQYLLYSNTPKISNNSKKLWWGVLLLLFLFWLGEGVLGVGGGVCMCVFLVLAGSEMPWTCLEHVSESS